MQFDRKDVRYHFETVRLTLGLLDLGDVEDVMAYEQRNRSHLAHWEPRRDPSAFENVAARRLEIARQRAEADEDRSYSFIAREAGGLVVARATLSNVVRGAFQACHLGYSVDGVYEGKGLAFEAVGAVVRFAFGELRLHRVMANYQPGNKRSGNLLRRLGFEVEGFARNYLYIDGEWRDHILTAIIRSEQRDDAP